MDAVEDSSTPSVYAPVIVTSRTKRVVRVAKVQQVGQDLEVDVEGISAAQTSSLVLEGLDGNTFRTTTRRSSTLPGSTPTPPSRSNSLSISRPVSKVLPAESSHPFDVPSFREGLMKAGYLETLDTSRKRIKSRFTHALEKEKFKLQLEEFLSAKSVSKRGEYMIRFVGQQDVHSPFVHLYTTSIPEDILTIRVHPEQLLDSEPDRFTTWTHLRTIKGASHWSCRCKGFWPLRVVLDGPGGEDSVPKLDQRPAEVEQAEELPVSTRKATEQVKASADTTSQSPTSPVPTIFASVRQLGQSLVKSLPPSVGTSIESFPQTFTTGIDNLKQSWSSWAAPKMEEGIVEFDVEREREKERRRERRARRAARRASAEQESGESDFELSKEERRARRRWEKSRAD